MECDCWVWTDYNNHSITWHDENKLKLSEKINLHKFLDLRISVFILLIGGLKIGKIGSHLFYRVLASSGGFNFCWRFLGVRVKVAAIAR